MKIAICIISICRYNKFLIPLLNSIEKFMFSKHEKTIFLFSDIGLNKENVKVISAKHLPSPLITLLRFENLTSIKDDLKKFDLVYYIDVDCLIVKEISDDVLPIKIGQIVATEHPWGSSNGELYESNPKSTAYVDKNLVTNNSYYQGCFFGGYQQDFITMSEILKHNIRCDLKNRIIAKWWDESHMNKYFIENPPKKLHGGYAYPDFETWKVNFEYERKIIHYNYHDN